MAIDSQQALSEQQAQQRLVAKGLDNWRYQDNALQRVQKCRQYLDALALVNRIGLMAEDAQHHPDILLHYKQVTIRYWTHTANGVTEIDIEQAILAESMIQSEFT